MKYFYIILSVFVCFNFQVTAQIFTVPYFDDFESGAPGWISTSNAGSAWQLGAPVFGQTNSVHSGSNCWDINLNTAYANNAHSSLISPEFVIPNSSAIVISFWQNRMSEQMWDGVVMEYITDTTSGVWSLVGSYNASFSSNWYSDSSLYSTQLPGWSGNSQGWVQSTITIPNPSTTGSIWFRFRFTSDASIYLDGFSIDDFNISESDLNVATGTVYLDVNSNNTIDAGDTPIPNIAMNCIPGLGGYYQLTDSSGNYSFFIGNGIATTITPIAPIYSSSSPATQTVTLNGTNLTSSGNDFLITYLPGIIDMEVGLWGTGVRPGFSNTKFIHLANTGTTPVSGTVELTFDNILTFVNSTTPATVTGPNTVEFAYAAIIPGQYNNIAVYFDVDSNAVVGTQSFAYVIVNPLASDTNVINNYDTLINPVVNSCDPNEKIVEPAGDISTTQVSAGMDLNYTINFQNTGTAEAIHVNVYDILDDNLDLFTFEIIGSSHAMTSWSIGSNKQLHCSFANINLPDSTTDEPGSHGFISYRVRPLTNLAVGTQITNTAAIFFDNNLPVLTNTTTSTVVIPTGIPSITNDAQLLLFPNPNSGSFYLQASSEFSNFKIYNAIGQEVYFQNISAPGKLQQIELNKLPHGLYMVVVSGNKSTKTSTILIE